MHDLLSKEALPLEVKQEETPKILLWSRLGPALLLAAFAIFLFRAAPSYWPLTLTSFLGYAVICMLKKKGLLFSLIALLAVLIFMPGKEVFWTALLGTSIAISWTLIYLGSLETDSFTASWEERFKSLEEDKQKVVKQLRTSLLEEQNQRAAQKQRLDALVSENANLQSRAFEIVRIREENTSLQNKLTELSLKKVDERQLAEQKQHLDTALSENVNLQSRIVELSRICEELLTKQGSETEEQKQRLDTLQSENIHLQNRVVELSRACDALSTKKITDAEEQKQRLDTLQSENSHLQSRVAELSRACDALSTQKITDAEEQKQRLDHLLHENTKLQNRIAELSIKNEDETLETDPEEKFRLEQLQYQFAALRGQFEEKSEALNQARRDLFRVENEFLALQIAEEEKKYEPSPEDAAYLRDLKTLEENCKELELQVTALQDFISALLLPKKRANTKKTKELVQELLPGLSRKK